MELLLNCVKPFIRLKQFFDHLEDRRLGVKEILKRAVLIRLRPLLLLMGASSVLRNEAKCILHCSLITQKLHEELIRRR